ncbi:hypothetical protein F5Y19DRAFT_483754 [Xylariaceae sp. FL1651]|nr:hypothetical protein F5Y19DRAFT_483754 [Xylariaceae sp. FL1651]
MDFLLDACEGLVANTISIPDDDSPISFTDTKRWQSLFGFTRFEAERRFGTGDQTLAVKSSAKGFDKESYEYSLRNQRLSRTQPINPAGESRQLGTKEEKGDRMAIFATPKNERFLLKLKGEISPVTAVQAIGKLSHPPLRYEGENEDGDRTGFCIVNTDAKRKILQGWADLDAQSQPIFIRLQEAEKDLSAICRYPTLGIDKTMPQHRLGNKERSTPCPDEYPVWYFFYGTLADKDILGRLLQRSVNQAALRPAYVLGGKLVTLGKYRALVHEYDLKGEPVAGSAFLVQTREEEDSLRHYETDLYAVVRCAIHISSDAGREKDLELNGLTFLDAT